MEEVVWVDEQDKELGIIPREVSHREGQLHRIVVVYLVNNKGQILIQERVNGRLDHSSAGHVSPGESYLEAAKRELKEELGIESAKLVSIGKTTSFDTGPNEDQKIYHIFEVFKTEAQPGELNKDEVKSVKWEDPKIILSDMQKNPDSKYTNGFRASLNLLLGSL